MSVTHGFVYGRRRGSSSRLCVFSWTVPRRVSSVIEVGGISRRVGARDKSWRPVYVGRRPLLGGFREGSWRVRPVGQNAYRILKPHLPSHSLEIGCMRYKVGSTQLRLKLQWSSQYRGVPTCIHSFISLLPSLLFIAQRYGVTSSAVFTVSSRERRSIHCTSATCLFVLRLVGPPPR